MSSWLQPTRMEMLHISRSRLAAVNLKGLQPTPTLAAQDDVPVRGADVGVEVGAVSFVQVAGQTPPWEQTHRFNTEDTKYLFTYDQIFLLKQQLNVCYFTQQMYLSGCVFISRSTNV